MSATAGSAEHLVMGFQWVARHAIELAAVGVVLAGMAVVLTFARPSYHPAPTQLVVRMANRKHYSVTQLRQAFHDEGIELVRTATLGDGTVVFTDGHPGKVDDAFTATLYGRNATLMLDATVPNPPLFWRQKANVMVSYGGHNKAFASRVAAASDALVR